MNDQLKSVCEDLDNLAIEYITEADSIAKLKQNVGNVLTKVTLRNARPPRNRSF